MEAYRTATIKAQSEGHALATSLDVLAVIRRWQGNTLVVSRSDIFEAIEMLGHKLADMPAPERPSRARPVVL